MTREEWEKGIQQWQQSGGQEGAKAADPKAAAQADDSGGGWLDTAGSFIKGAGREIATQGGFAQDFAKGGDPNSWPEWAGRQAVDFAPSVALDAFAPEIGVLPTAWRGAKFVNEAVRGGVLGALGGAGASPDNRQGGAQTGAEVGAGGSMIGQVIGSRPVHRLLLPAAIAAEVAQHGGVLPHGVTGGLYPWALAHGLSALAGLARAAGVHAPAKAGAIGARVQQTMDNSQ